MKRIFAFVISMFVYASVSAQLSDQLVTPLQTVGIEMRDGFSIVNLAGSDDYNNIPGHPMLPVIFKTYVLPVNVNVDSLSIIPSIRKAVNGKFTVFPVQFPVVPDGSEPQAFYNPDPGIYHLANPYPGFLAEIKDNGIQMGYRILTIAFNPVEYSPTDSSLFLYDTIQFTIHYSSTGIPWNPPRSISEYRKKMVTSFIKGLVNNPLDVDNVTGGVNGVSTDNSFGDFQISDQFPLNLGVNPDMIIITRSKFKDQFRKLADWKTKKGIPTAIATLEDDIIGKYPGCDSAEQIRNYLINLDSITGPGLFILLGGDVDEVPCRMIREDDEAIPADLYYVTKGSWNTNANHMFCEFFSSNGSSDCPDQHPWHFIGRVPVGATGDVDSYVHKVLEYERLIKETGTSQGQPLNYSFLKRMLVMTGSAEIGDTSWRNQVLRVVSNPVFVPTEVNKHKLLDIDGDEALSKATAMSNLNKNDIDGYGFVIHLDHSGPITMGTSAKVMHQQLVPSDVNALTNGHAHYIVFSDGCRINKINLNCISKSFINNHNGAGVAFIGKNVSDGFHQESLEKLLTRFFYESQFNHLGFAFTKAYSSGPDQSFNPNYNLLGDPELPNWGYWGASSTPPILSMVSGPATVSTGPDTLSLTVGNLVANQYFRICVSKKDEIYKSVLLQSTGTNCPVQFYINPKSAGMISVVITSKNHRPFEDTIFVNPASGTNLFVSGTELDDSASPYGNNNGVGDEGEGFKLTPVVTNSGQTASIAYSTISLTPLPSNTVSVSAGPHSLPVIPAGSSADIVPEYQIKMGSNTGDFFRQRFKITMGSFTDTTSLTIHAPVFSLYSVSMTEPHNGVVNSGDTLYLLLKFRNFGSGLGTGLKGILHHDNSGNTLILQDLVNYGDCPPYTYLESTIPYVVKVNSALPGDTLKFTVELKSANTYGQVWTFAFNLTPPTQMVQKISFSSTENRIRLFWEPPAQSVRGYNVYRSSSINGSYSKLNDHFIEGYTLFIDHPLTQATTYYYKVSVVSPFGIEGALSAPVRAWTTIPYRPGWPVTTVDPSLGSYTQGSPVAEDVNHDMKKEIFLCTGDDETSEKGGILAFREDGREFLNFDGNPTFDGGFYQFDRAGSSSTPVICDINNDGRKEIVVTTRRNNNDPIACDRGQIFALSTVVYDNGFSPHKYWNTEISSDYKGVVAASSNLEIAEPDLIGAKGNWFQKPWLLNAVDGTTRPGWPPSQVLAVKEGLGMPVIADIDGNGELEFAEGFSNHKQQSVVTSDAGIHIWKSNGSWYHSNFSDSAFFKVKSPGNSEFDRMDSPPVIADMNNDNHPDLICLGSEIHSNSPSISVGHLFILNNQGATLPGWSYVDPNHVVSLTRSDSVNTHMPAPVVADVDDDGQPEVFLAGQDTIYGWNSNGSVRQHFPIYVDGLETRGIAPLLADVDGDGTIEIIVASNDSIGGIHAYHIADGTQVQGWPLRIGKIDATPSIDDIDYDGKNELMVSVGASVHVFNTNGKSDRILWGKFRLNSFNNAVYSKPCQYTSTPLIIDNNLAINNDVYIPSDIVVEPGGTLTVRGNLKMPNQSLITIKSGDNTVGGGILIIDGGKITTDCGGLWKGIEVWGNPNITQNERTAGGALIQGQIVVKNGGAILNAEIAILASRRSANPNDDNLYGFAGGLITTDSAFFINNRYGVFFDPYDKWNSSHLNRTHFRTNAALKDNTTPGWFISANGIKSLAINGCSFKNTRGESEVNFAGRGNGIHSWNSGLFIDSYCFQPQNEGCARSEPCVFQKLTRGVYSLNSAGAASVRLNGARFIDNKFGAYFSAFDNIAHVEVFSNTFELGTNVPEKGYGLYLDNCTGFHIEDNEFYRVPSSDIKGIGLVVNNSGTAPNEIYRNRFHNLKNATISQNVNRSYNPPLDLGGLCYKCNTFVKGDGSEPNLVDFAITYKDIPYGPNVGIAKNQGSQITDDLFNPAGNMFHFDPDSAHYDFYNDGNPIIYYFPNSSVLPFRLVPLQENIFGTVIGKSVAIQFNTEYCPSKIGVNSASENEDEFINAQVKADSIDLVLLNQVDGGSTEMLNSTILTSAPADAVQTYFELLTNSPSLSDTVIKSSIYKEDVLSNTMIRDVLVANPQSAKSDEIIDLLEKRSTPVPEYMMEQILAGTDSIGNLEKLEAKKEFWAGEASTAYIRTLKQFKGDSITPPNSDSLNWLFDFRGTLSSSYDQLVWRHTQHENELVAEALESIPSMFNLSSEQISTHSAYNEVLPVLSAVHYDTTFVLRLDSTNESQLQILAENYSTLPNAYARNLLLAKGRLDYFEPVILTETGLKESRRKRSYIVSEDDIHENIFIYPNPSHDFFILSTDLPENYQEGIIKIYGLQGTLMKSINFRGGHDQLLVRAELQPGVYFLELLQNNRRTGTRMFIVE